MNASDYSLVISFEAIGTGVVSRSALFTTWVLDAPFCRHGRRHLTYLPLQYTFYYESHIMKLL